ncbi:MAG: hypothetical protein ABL927_01825 [Bdellovibrionales bacterium]
MSRYEALSYHKTPVNSISYDESVGIEVAIIRVMRAMKHTFLLMITLLAGVLAQAQAYELTGAERPGYVWNVVEERAQVVHEVIIAPDISTNKIRLVDEIFTQKLSKEFSKEFRNRFGYTEFEQLQFTSDRTVQAGVTGRLVPVAEYLDKQEKFGQFMGKELTEYHVDKYLRSGKNTRKIYEVKQKISNVEVKTASGSKLKLKYRLSSNRLNVILERPSEKFHKQIEMAPNGTEATIRLGYDLSKTISFGTDLAIQDQSYGVQAIKRLTRSLSTSITGQSFQKTIGSTPKQNRLLVGLSWND